ncbi:integrase [Paraburkholderia caffeinilytica]|uniref:Tyrosine recombinase XerC n=1 Tax=Paraburkholderia caffeinilytica TaxID=1761016 RepID=A0ABQ1NE26_9BURK|nr:tyrosine-type recombinase/integrase [Paraburkholderia caffeinilytica]AXL50877.1 integrase [Paraburkholderia caffeinilytica]GGC66900.1 hypothetical protein GCM10011400_63550 [Paraburkholderia caffeinilytica]CAB3803509.1 Tyrosine recombinase XerC [Paraburkholderia caffeinilytica]
MNPSGWIDTAASPPQPLPDSIDAALDYLAGATGHPVYTRWTLSRLKRGCPSLADAKREHPAVFALLLEHEAAVEYWDRGRLRVVPAADAPPPETILERVLHQHRRRFHEVAYGNVPVTAGSGASSSSSLPATATAAVRLAALGPPPLAQHAAHAASTTSCAAGGWLARAGRFVNPSMVTNTLGVMDDAQAVLLFLRDRASRSPHTLRAYLADLRRLIAWCERERLGPLSDLTRHDLLAYRRAIELHQCPSGQRPDAGEAAPSGSRPRIRSGQPHIPLARSTAVPSRALAVVSSLFRYWLRTGYLIANPAADLCGGSAARAAWTPSRIMPAGVIALCDAVVAGAAPADLPALVWARRCAIWSLYRYGGVRLAELVWSDATGLPRLDADADTDSHWTLHVLGKGGKLRAIPLPAVALPPLRAYRLARGLPPVPVPFERLPVIHSEKRDALGASGLYDEVKAVFRAAENRVAPGDGVTRTVLRAASTHWLRHGYAHTLVVDHAVPLPVAQQLLGHASVQTTAAYAKSDLTQARAFVEGSFPRP